MGTELSTRAIHLLIKDQEDKQVSEDSAKEPRTILERFAGDGAEKAFAVTSEGKIRKLKYAVSFGDWNPSFDLHPFFRF